MRIWSLSALLLLVAACAGAASEDAPNGQESNIDGSSKKTTPSAEERGEAPPNTPAAARPVDSCDAKKAACTAPPAGFAEGSGLVEVDRCAFALEESAGLGGALPPLVAAVEGITKKVSVGDVLASANRTATTTTSVPGSPPNVTYAFRWQEDDDSSTAWIPQGLTGTVDGSTSGTIDGKNALLVSFYNHPAEGELNKGVRIAFVDTSVPASPKYRFALLVEAKGTAEAPTIAPIKIHAGGIAWFGNWLYVADTSRGFRVFDMRHILEVNTSEDTFGCAAGVCRAGQYRYVIPQVGKYEVASTCAPLFSYVSLDRSTDPPSLLSGEYCSTTACNGSLHGRVFRWPLDPATGLLRSKTTFPTEAFLMSHKQVQGAASYKDRYFLSSSAPAAGGGELYRVPRTGKSTTQRWSNTPEDLMVDAEKGWLWSLSEGTNERAVYAVKLP